MMNAQWQELKAKAKAAALEVTVDTVETNADEVTVETLVVRGERGLTKFEFRARKLIDEGPRGIFTDSEHDYAFNEPAMTNWLRIWRQPNGSAEWTELSMRDLFAKK